MNEQNSATAHRHTARDPIARRAAEEATTRLIGEAIDSKPGWGAQRWCPIIRAQVADLGHEPPSRSAVMRLFTAERGRRRQARVDAGRRAAEAVGAAIGDQRVALVQGDRLATRDDFEGVVSSVIAIPSKRIGAAWQDYLGGKHRARREGMSAEDFAAILYSSKVVGLVAHESMPEWWRRKVARLAR